MELVELEKHGPIAIIRMNRPEKLNAMNAQLLADLRAAYEEYEHDQALAVAIVTGNGRAFSAGRDIREQEEALGGGLANAATSGAGDLYMNNGYSKPFISAVNGFAGGSGYLLATRFVDMVVAAESAIFEITEVRLGQLYGWQAGYEFGMPRTAAMELAYGFPISGRRAFEIGLANDVAPNAELMNVAMKRAEHVARMPATVLRYNRELVRRLTPAIPPEIEQLGRNYREASSKLPDFVEGDRAFLERRQPKFTA